jgi:hypothetical protein
MNIGDKVIGNLNNFCFGGTITQIVTTTDWVTKENKYTYTVRTPANISIESNDVNKAENN